MTRMVRSLALVFMFIASLGFASDPVTEFRSGRAALEKRDYAAAVDAFQRALTSIGELPEAERPQALAALHFYSALAHYKLGKEDDAREDLARYFTLQPNGRADPNSYEAGFIQLFNEVRTAPRQGGANTFDQMYPHVAALAAPRKLTADTPALTFLATHDEKDEWDRISGDAAREEFLARFWKRRDPSPDDDANEFRREFEERVALADFYFATVEERGAMTDRGKVFLLLGKPGSVQSRGMQPSDGELSMLDRQQYGDATLEIWRYRRSQLPAAVPTAGVTYLFVTHKRLGDHMLQNMETMAHRALLAAASDAVRRK